MKIKTILSLMVALGFSLLGNSVLADGTNTPPVIVDGNKDNIPTDLKEIKALVKAFEAQRDTFLAEQKVLLEKLKGATTAEQRAVIRDRLQDNRTAFLAELKEFRQELREEVREIKDLIHDKELQRLLNAAGPITDPHHPK